MSRALRLDIQFKMLAGLLARVASELRAHGGPRFLRERVLDPVEEAGHTVGRSYVKRFGIGGNNAVAAGLAAVAGLESYDATYQVSQATSTQFEARVIACPRKDATEEFGEGSERAGCETCGSFLSGLARAASPDADFAMPKRLGWGDPLCSITIVAPKGAGGPEALRVPSDLRFLSTAARRELAINHLAAQLRAITTPQAGETPVASQAARSLAYAGYPVGLRDGRRALDVFGIKSVGIEAAALIVRNIDQVQEVRHEALDRDEEGFAWKTMACTFQELMPQPPRGPSADRICAMCRNYHEGLAEATGRAFQVAISKRLAAGDGYCQFEAKERPRSQWVRHAERGQLDYGLARVAMLGGTDTFPLLWELYGASLQSVGQQAAARSVRSMVRDELLAKDDAGLRKALDHWTEAGWGDFQLEKVDLTTPEVVVTLPNGFEAQAVGTREPAPGAACHFTQGVIRGAVEEVTGRKALVAEESACRIRGDDTCTYRVWRPN